jgi:hypothetical protein
MRLDLQRPRFSRIGPLDLASLVDRDRIVVPHLNNSFPDDRTRR